MNVRATGAPESFARQVTNSLRLMWRPSTGRQVIEVCDAISAMFSPTKVTASPIATNAMYQEARTEVGAMVMALHKDADARAYAGFTASEPIEYDHRDIDAQKRLMAERVAGAGWVLPRIAKHMMTAPDFHFDSVSQVRMDSWSRGRIVLLGDAGYSVALASGQGTTVAMVGAYVLAGALAMHVEDLAKGIASYENELRDYVTRNQEIAFEQHAQALDLQTPGEPTDNAENAAEGGLPDFGALTLPFQLKDYDSLLRRSRGP